MSEVVNWLSTVPAPKGLLDGARSSHYGLTDSVVRNAGIAANVAASFSLTTCLGFIVASIWVYSYTTCRHTLDRVSFRLLVVAMFWEFWYSFNFLLLYINDTMYQPGHSWGPSHCTAGVYFLVSAMHVVDFLVMFIALNLFLTIKLGINPVKLRLERWYIGISITLGYMIPLPSAIKQHFGWDYALGTCWIHGRGRKTRFKYLLEGIYITPIITCLVSTVCVAIVLVVLFRQGRATSRALFGGQGGKQKIDDDSELDSGSGSGLEEISLNPISNNSDPITTLIVSNINYGTGTNTNINIKDNSLNKLPQDTQNQNKINKFTNRFINFTIGKGFLTNEEIIAKKSQSYFNSLSDKFFSIAIKISCYPITILFINSILIIGDLLIAAQGGVKSHKTVWLYIVYYVFYGGRGICIAGLAIVIDPSLVRGMKAAWQERKIRRNPDLLPTTLPSSTENPASPTYSRSPYSTVFDGITSPGQTVIHTPNQMESIVGMPLSRPRIDSDTSFDFATALAYMPDPEFRKKEKDQDNKDLPTVELDLSYLNQELDTSILKNDTVLDKDISSGLDVQYPTSPPRSLQQISNQRADSSRRTGFLDKLPTPINLSSPSSDQNQNFKPKVKPNTKPALTLKPLNSEYERKKEEQRKRNERVKEIKRRFEEVQSHL